MLFLWLSLWCSSGCCLRFLWVFFGSPLWFCLVFLLFFLCISLKDGQCQDPCQAARATPTAMPIPMPMPRALLCCCTAVAAAGFAVRKARPRRAMNVAQITMPLSTLDLERSLKPLTFKQKRRPHAGAVVPKKMCKIDTQCVDYAHQMVLNEMLRRLRWRGQNVIWGETLP